ncbi:helicase-exonuclease AddAB subunit AddA [Lactobacillus sp. DCY120]|uniref:ATP-dependent helicase/nuclease subunit A n=1 Tax=Bombilactobacillus apium TaxID=2675299 RepID=A0A850R1C6_9LACO|nr:helicase-exonuclease AddAB subunit AddA [Bombilactobacillus apium]NVY95821.1 helicase-exonuclease AddAB subunit AddA [Bombilactobacillus apium]
MAHFKATPSQQKALTAQGSDILVSASAGSGKTTILVDRIIRELTAGQELSHLLVVTFTDAAAQEMKQRLTKKLRQTLATATNPAIQAHLSRQLQQIPAAQISTLHAFCLKILQKFYYLIALNPGFRLLSDDNERSLLQERAWEKVRHRYYQQSDEAFYDLESNFVTGSDDEQMATVIFQLTNFALTNQDPQNWLQQLTQSYQPTEELTNSSFYQQQFLPLLANEFHYCKLQINQAMIASQSYDELTKFQDSLKKLQEQLAQLLAELPQQTWDNLRRSVLELVPITGRVKPKSDPEIAEPFKEQRKAITAQIQTWQYKFFALDNASWQQITQQSQNLVSKLIEVEEQFLKQFQLEKKRQHALDFNDLEHYALQILQATKNEQPIAQEYYYDLFDEILIDEYQDTNPLQEAIIQTFKHQQPGNLFMVGDVKQSIYGFRQAAPYLFTGKYQAMQADTSNGQLIHLAENFRSAPNVLSSVNAIFKRIMDQEIGDLDYDQESELISGTTWPQNIDSQTEVLLQTEPLTAPWTRQQAQIQVIIEQIQALMAQDYQIYNPQTQTTRTLQYSDIAILTRVKTWNNDLVAQFQQAQIPIVVQDTTNYFQTTEVQTMLALLQVIDNPEQDIPLVAVLRSALVGLKENELAYLRINQHTGDYYQAVTHYLKNPSRDNDFTQQLTEKMQHFQKQLENWRQLTPKISLAELIWQIYLDTGYLTYVQGLANGQQRGANLHALYQRAQQFEQMEFKGLFQFVRFIKHLQANQKDLAQPLEANRQQNEVQVMTIHGSKGLEFPLVFVLGIDHQFNTSDLKQKYLLDTQGGLGIKYRDLQTQILYESLQFSAMKVQKKNKNISEEIRLLYVALTRAQQKLFLVGATKVNPEQTWQKWQLPTGAHQATVLDSSLRMNFNSFQDCLKYVLGENSQLQAETMTKNDPSAFDFQIQFVDGSQNITSGTNKKTILDSSPAAENSELVSELFRQTAAQILNFEYPYSPATVTTAYQSVSEIKHLFADPADQKLPILDPQTSSTGQRFFLPEFSRPNFLTTTASQITAAEVGSATHLLLQQVSLKQIPTVATFQQFAQQLVQKRILSAALAEKINYQSLGQFYQSALGQQIYEHQQSLKREWSFSLLLPANKIFADPTDSKQTDQILVHGIIDGLFIDDQDQVTLFDYKTDYLEAQKKSGPHSIAQAVTNYSGQLNLYQTAAEQILQRNVTQKYLCFLSINQLVRVK